MFLMKLISKLYRILCRCWGKGANGLENFDSGMHYFEVIDLARKKQIHAGRTWIKAKVWIQIWKSKTDRQLSLFAYMQLTRKSGGNPLCPIPQRKCAHDEGGGQILEWQNAGKSIMLRTGYAMRAPELLFEKFWRCRNWSTNSKKLREWEALNEKTEQTESVKCSICIYRRA